MARFEPAHSNFERLNRTLVETFSGADFSEAQELVRKAEGGYQRNENDNGNWTGGKKGSGTLIGTNLGISAPTLSRWLGREATEKDMRSLTYEEAKKIYKKFFWDNIKGDDIKSQDVANIVYDAYVNQTGWTKTMLNDTLKKLGKEGTATIPLKPDTIASINEAKPDKFFDEFKKQRELRYKQQAEKSGQAGFLKGWMRRLEDFTYSGIRFAKRNWKAITISLIGIGTLAYLGIRYRAQIAKFVFK